AVFRLRANDHDRRLLRLAMARWSQAMTHAVDRARSRQRDLLRCIGARGASEERQRLGVDRKRLRQVARECVRGGNTHLHSSAAASLIVTVEEMLASWLGLYVDWMASDRKTPKPSFPTLPPLTDRAHEERHRLALAMFAATTDLAEENRWRAEVMRAARGRRLPFAFGAATAGGEHGFAHCGIVRREDGRC